MNTLPAVLTIGHSNHSIEVFLGLLKKHSVTALADVRSVPYSRFNPQFNKDDLENSLKSHGIKYVFLGRELGGRSDDISCYENGQIQYARLALTEQFRAGIERVIHAAGKYRIALMCAEKEPLECHRTLLVARALAENGIAIQHILANGRIETHTDAMSRLLDMIGLPQEDMVSSRKQLIEQALARQEKQIAYTDETMIMGAGRGAT